MNHPAPSHPPPTAFFRSGERLRSRSVSDVVLTGTVDVPMPPTRLLADWEREISSQLALEPGDVEPLPLARARARWPDYRLCVQAASDWAQAQGLPGVLASSDVALMACRGAKYHHDGMQYGFAAFCNLFMSEDKGLDLHFPAAGRRIPLRRGTTAIFDTGQPHAVIRRGSSGFDAADFAHGSDCNLVFLTWELPIEDASVAKALRIEFDVAAANAARPDEESLMLGGKPAVVNPASGQWMRNG
ncbi:hypothetical protein [Variovorax sp. tm]|uniref:hypothetical protein n=1 Tax=Variovorax atrisoli TaxID=3394203 RepID=UPI003A8032C6